MSWPLVIVNQDGPPGCLSIKSVKSYSVFWMRHKPPSTLSSSRFESNHLENAKFWFFFFCLLRPKTYQRKLMFFFFSSWKYMILMSENDFKSSKIFKINKWNTLDCLGHFSHKMTVAHSLWVRSLLERPFSGWQICWLLFTIKQIQILKLYPPNYECIHNRNNWQIAPKYWKYFVYISTHWMQSKMRYLFFSAKMSIMDMLIISKHYQK